MKQRKHPSQVRDDDVGLLRQRNPGGEILNEVDPIDTVLTRKVTRDDNRGVGFDREDASCSHRARRERHDAGTGTDVGHDAAVANKSAERLEKGANSNLVGGHQPVRGDGVHLLCADPERGGISLRGAQQSSIRFDDVA